MVLKVRDAGKSKDFYVKTLGLKVAYEDLTRGAVFLSFGTEHHDLAVFQMASGETPAAEQPGLHHMAWQLGSFEELRDAHRELQAMGVPIESRSSKRDAHIYFPDPRRQYGSSCTATWSRTLRDDADGRSRSERISFGLNNAG